MLLLHLLHVIPRSVCVEILAERKFFQCLAQRLRILLESCKLSASTSNARERGHISPQSNGERPTKRRRLSSEQGQPSSPNGTSLPDIVDIVLQVCCRFADIVATDYTHGQADANPGGLAWTSSVHENAMCFDASLQIALACLRGASSRGEEAMSSAQVTKLSALWDCRPVVITDTAKATDVAAFNTSCLSPCLEFLDLCTKMSDRLEPVKSCIQRVEKLLAIHTILPLRARFNEHQARKWKKGRICLSWQDVEPVYNDMMEILSPEHLIDNGGEAKLVDLDWRRWSRHLYSIAVRLIPKSDFKRRQWEQPWLDALFVSLSYVSWPTLPRLDFTAPNTVTPLISGKQALDDDDIRSVCGLVEVALYQRMPISLQILSYITAAALSQNSFAQDLNPVQYDLISVMISLDVNILVPGLGVPTTDYNLEKFRENVLAQLVSETEYAALLQNVILPLIDGFARSRALRDLLTLWRTEMELAMEMTPSEDGKIHAITVWQDEDTCDKVIEAVRQHATPSLIRDFLVSTTLSLEKLGGSQSVLHFHSGLIVCTALLQAQEFLSASIGQLESIQDAAISNLKQGCRPLDDRWHLWSLIYHIQETQLTTSLPASTLAITSEGNESLCLDALKIEERGGELHLLQWRERLARFSVLVQQSSKQDQPFCDSLKTEMDALTRLFGTLRTDMTLWNGCLRDLDCLEKFIPACLGVLLQRPEVLRLQPKLAQTVLEKFLRAHAAKQSPNGPSEAASSVPDLLLAFIESLQMNSSKQVTEKLNQTILEAASEPKPAVAALDLMKIVPVESISKSRLRAAASAMSERLSADVKEVAPEQLAGRLTLMDRLSANSLLSFCQAAAWPTWLEVLGAMEKREFAANAPDTSVIIRCVASMLRKVMASVVEEEVKHNGKLLSLALKWSKEIIKSPSPIEVGPNRFLALEACMSTLCSMLDKLSETSSKDFKKQCRGYVQRLSDEFIKVLHGGASQTAYFQATCLLLALSEVEAVLPVPPDLISIVRGFELACEGSFNTHSDDPGGFPEHVIGLSTLCRRYLERWEGKSYVSPLWTSVVETSLAYPNSLGEISEQNQLALVATRAHNLVQTLGSDGQADLLELMAQGRWADMSGTMVPCMVTAVILQEGSSTLSDCPRLVEHLSAVVSLDGSPRVKDQTMLLLSLENAQLALELQPKIVNQATIDALLANISFLLSSTSLLETGFRTCAEAIFDRTIALIGSLLSHFRRRLSDRHHLLLPILQQLLRCFFFPGSNNLHSHRPPAQGSNPGAFLKALPPWMLSSPQPLRPSSAEKFTRLISSICNPTVSAARSSSRKRSGASNELNDDTKRVKALAGEHMQYLVMEYCRCTLDGEITPQVKEKLLPGMYVVLESMSRDMMRGMNAAMDPSAKAIFKGLYDDWVRYGRWDRS